jgi:hypothetical protein
MGKQSADEGEVTGGWRELHYDDDYNLHPLLKLLK